MSTNTYSFLDVQAAIQGSGLSALLSEGGISEEGITVSMIEEKATMTIGVDGTPMHSLHASKGGTVIVRLLKTSPLNAVLNQGYVFQTASSANYGDNLITIRNPVRGDSITCQQCGFRKLPDNVSAKAGGMQEWAFNAGIIDMILGSGVPG